MQLSQQDEHVIQDPRGDPAESSPLWFIEAKQVKSLSAFQHALGFSSRTTRIQQGLD